ncbi:MAG: hypothetical protein Q7V62_01845 [Actinomycetota bacterium]|nr:hypothetical protein [Actinomycetota bacterium]
MSAPPRTEPPLRPDEIAQWPSWARGHLTDNPSDETIRSARADLERRRKEAARAATQKRNAARRAELQAHAAAPLPDEPLAGAVACRGTFADGRPCTYKASYRVQDARVYVCGTHSATVPRTALRSPYAPTLEEEEAQRARAAKSKADADVFLAGLQAESARLRDPVRIAEQHAREARERREAEREAERDAEREALREAKRRAVAATRITALEQAAAADPHAAQRELLLMDAVEWLRADAHVSPADLRLFLAIREGRAPESPPTGTARYRAGMNEEQARVWRELEWLIEPWQHFISTYNALVRMLWAGDASQVPDDIKHPQPSVLQWMRECRTARSFEASDWAQCTTDIASEKYPGKSRVATYVSFVFHARRLRVGEIQMTMHRRDNHVLLDKFANSTRADKWSARARALFFPRVDMRGVMTNVLAALLGALRLPGDATVTLEPSNLAGDRGSQAALIAFYVRVFGMKAPDRSVSENLMFASVSHVLGSIAAEHARGGIDWAFTRAEFVVVHREREFEDVLYGDGSDAADSEDDEAEQEYDVAETIAAHTADEVTESPAKKARMRARFTLHD